MAIQFKRQAFVDSLNRLLSDGNPWSIASDGSLQLRYDARTYDGVHTRYLWRGVEMVSVLGDEESPEQGVITWE